MSYARRHSTNVCPGNRVRYTQGLLNGLVRLDWRIDWIAGGHGGVVPFTDLHSHYVQ